MMKRVILGLLAGLMLAGGINVVLVEAAIVSPTSNYILPEAFNVQRRIEFATPLRAFIGGPSAGIVPAGTSVTLLGNVSGSYTLVRLPNTAAVPVAIRNATGWVLTSRLSMAERCNAQGHCVAPLEITID